MRIDVVDVVAKAAHRGAWLRALGLYEAAHARLTILVAELPNPAGMRNNTQHTPVIAANDLRELVKILDGAIVAMREAADASEAFQAIDAEQRLGGVP